MKKIVWLVVGVIVFTLSVVKGSYGSDTEALIKLLINKGIISEAELEGLKAELKQAPAKKPALEVEVGEGESALKVKVSGFIQTQFEHYDDAVDTFTLLRARPKIKADLGEYVDFFVQLDLAYDVIMRDAWVELDYLDYAKFRMGQFTLPFGWQTPVSPYDLLTINYAQVVSQLNGGDDLRDTGMMLHGNFKESNIPLLKRFNYAIACVNGEGSNISEQNDQKSFVGRIGFRGPIEGLELGISGYHGDRGTARYERKRLGADLRYKWENLLIQGEYIHSNDDTVASSIEPHTLQGEGYFIEVGYKLTPQIQPVFKFDVWDPEVPGIYGRLNKYAAGLNWYINDWTRLQAIYEFKDEENNEINNNAFITQLGIAF